MLKVNNSRNLVLFALLVGVLVLAVLLLWDQKPPPDDATLSSEDDATLSSEDDVVDIFVGAEPVPIPGDFKKTLQGMNIEGLALVDNTRQLRVITIDGTYRDLCGPNQEGSEGGRTCELDTTVKALVSAVSGAGECGVCKISGMSGRRKSCHLTGDNKGWYKCDDGKRNTHKECYKGCR